MVDEAQVAQFCALTGAKPDTAIFYLESAGDNYEAALDTYFATAGSTATEQGQAGGLGVPTATSKPEDPKNGASSHVPPENKPAAGRTAPSSGRIKSLADLGADADDDDDDDSHNEYYAGGEKSGQVVKGAPSQGDVRSRIEDLFDSARRSGAADGNAQDLMGAGLRGGGGGRTSGFAAFAGRPRTLAGEENAPPPDVAAAAPASSARQSRTHVITFYRNGIFTVDDGEPRSIQDPSNAPFLRSIQRGECPEELEPAERGIQVTVNMLRRDEEYVQPAKPGYVAFKGSGRKLTDATAPCPAPAPAVPQVVSSSMAAPQFQVDDSQPTTSIQLRLANGTRVVQRFNLTHSVADVRSFIRLRHPDGPMAFRLTTAFPTKSLDDDSLTIQAAGLSNAVVMQQPL